MLKRLLKRRWVRWCVLPPVVLLILLALGTTVWWFASRWSGEARRAKIISELDALDPSWRQEDQIRLRNANLPPREMNAAIQAEELGNSMPKSFLDWEDTHVPMLHPVPTKVVGQLMDVEMLDDARAVVVDCQPFLNRVHALRKLPAGGCPTLLDDEYGVFIHTKHALAIRRLVSLLQLEARVLAADGKGDDAARVTLTIVHLCRAIGDEPSALVLLVRKALALIAVQSLELTLGVADVSDSVLVEVAREFVAESRFSILAPAVRGERAALHRQIDLADGDKRGDGNVAQIHTKWLNDQVSGSQGGGTSGQKQMPWYMPLFSLLYRATLPNQQAINLEHMRADLLAAQLPVGLPRDPHSERLNDYRRQRSWDTSLGLEADIACQKSAEVDDRTAAYLLAAVAAIDCERFRRAKGRYPVSFHEMSPDALTMKPVDPIDAEPLRLIARETGIVVYSVGLDRKDDGGATTDPQGFILGNDAGMQLLLPTHRRTPPPPKPKDDPDE